MKIPPSCTGICSSIHVWWLKSPADLQSLALSPRPYLLLASPAEADALKATAHVREIGSYRYLSLRFFTLNGVFAEPAPERLVLLANFDF